MFLRAYSIYDRKSLQYHQPFFAVTDGAATRILSDLANDTNTTIGRHPGDYVLYMVGKFDDQSGRLIVQDPINHVMDAEAVLAFQKSLPLEGAK